MNYYFHFLHYSISIVTQKNYLVLSNSAKYMTITFGRFTDAFKPKAKIDFWNQAEKLFNEKKYTESHDAFFNYLIDDSLNNVSWESENSRFDFQLQQGSKTVRGSINEHKIDAETRVAHFEKLSVSFMRRLMEMNYSLYYTRFAMKDDDIYIKFDSGVEDGHPRKLYYALRELSLRADKQDDLLVDEFSALTPVDITGEEEIPAEEKEIKYKYYKKWTEDALKRITELKEESFSGAKSYLLLDLLYKIDYLIVPEGSLENELEKISWGYFTKDNKPFEEKNRAIKESFEKLLVKPKDEILKSLYRTKATFGVANPAPHNAVVDAINSNINNVKWYVDNDYEDVAWIIFEYIAGYSLFSYGLPKPDIKLFHLLYNITQQDYFTALGLKEKYYDTSSKKFEEGAIKDKVNEIIKEGTEQFPELKFSTDNLKFDNMVSFLRSYITEIQNLNFNIP